MRELLNNNSLFVGQLYEDKSLALRARDLIFFTGHRPVNVKRAVIGSKGGWKLSTIFLSCKVFHDWSIIKLGNILYLLDGSIFALLFGTTSHCFC